MHPKPTRHRQDKAPPLGLVELVAIALGGMVGGGIFTVLGVSVVMVGVWTPLAIALGGALAALAAYSYVQLALYYRDGGATYAFFKRAFPGHDFAAALIGWWVVFGYIATIALYAVTFAAYALSATGLEGDPWARRMAALAVIAAFAALNARSTRGMGQVEDAMVYTKLAILIGVAGLLWTHADARLPDLAASGPGFSPLGILTIAAVTFVAYEGFQLVIHAMEEMDAPQRNIPRAIYAAVALATLVYVAISLGAVRALPFAEIADRQEDALAAGAARSVGAWGAGLVILGAVLATMSAISGTLFGASRLMAVIARDGFFPAGLTRRRGLIPVRGVWTMAGLSGALVLVGDLRLILEFGSITFLLVSLLMAWANHRRRADTGAHPALTLLALAGLAGGTVLILIYEGQHDPVQLGAVLALYVVLALGAFVFARA